MSLLPFVGATKAREHITISDRRTQKLLHPKKMVIFDNLSIQINCFLSLNHLSKTQVFKSSDWLNIVSLFELLKMVSEKTVRFIFSFGFCSLRINNKCFCVYCCDCCCCFMLEIFDLIVEHFYLVFARLLRGVTLHRHH